MQRKNIKGKEQSNQQSSGRKSQNQQPSTIMQGYLHGINGTLQGKINKNQHYRSYMGQKKRKTGVRKNLGDLGANKRENMRKEVQEMILTISKVDPLY